MKSWLEDKLSELCYAVGLCPRCKRIIRHDGTEPFANCGCGTWEWTFKPPFLDRFLTRVYRWWRRVMYYE